MVWPFSSAGSGAPVATGASACPVDHETRQRWEEQTKCPVDNDAQAAFLHQAKQNADVAPSKPGAAALSNEREISSIPRYYMEGGAEEQPASAHGDAEASEADSKWVYPSPSQFYTAIQRKNHDAHAEDMNVVVPIHNAVNEEAWRMIRDWEQSWTTPDAAAPQLVNFIGRPKDLTWRARFRNWAGYQLPFDRHDWVVVRPNKGANAPPQTMRYIIDFYAGRSPSSPSSSSASTMAQAGKGSENVSFYLDVRPAPDTIEGLAMRLHRWWLPTSNHA